MLQTCNGITALIPVLQIQLTPAQLQAIQMQLQGKQGNQPIIIQSSEQPAVQTIQTVTQADQSQFGQVRNAEPNLCSSLWHSRNSNQHSCNQFTHTCSFMNFKWILNIVKQWTNVMNLWFDLPGCVSDTTVT